MGTWDEGLLDNDAAHDGLADLHNEIVEEIVSLGTAKPTTATTSRLCAAVGVLLQLSPYHFALDSPSGPKIVSASRAHAASIGKLPTAARKVMTLIIDGKGKALAERPDKKSAAHGTLLHKGAKKSPFGQREPALFATKSGAAYVQSVARRCVETIDEDFEDEDNWNDLCREAVGMGLLAALMVLEPCTVALSKVEGWRKKARTGLASLRDEQDDELAFHELYYANLDAVLGVLAKRFA
jgi:hypothetical protein